MQRSKYLWVVILTIILIVGCDKSKSMTTQEQPQVTQNETKSKIELENQQKKLDAEHFHQAVRDNQLELAKQMSGTIDVNQPDERGETPLFQAVQNRNTEMISLLFSKGVDINHKNAQNQTVLDLPQTDTKLRLFLQMRGDMSSLHVPFSTIYSNQTDQLRAWLSNTKNPDEERFNGDTPLQFAIMMNDKEAVDALLRAKANPLLRNKDHRDAWELSVLFGDKDVQQFLMNEKKEFEQTVIPDHGNYRRDGNIRTRNITLPKNGFHKEWTATIPFVHSSPVIDGERIVFTAEHGLQLIVIDAVTGNKLWSYAIDTDFKKKDHKFFFGEVAVEQGTVYAGTNEGNLLAFKLETGEMVWEQKFGLLIESSLLVNKGLLYFEAITGNGHICFALDLNTRKVVWKHSLDDPSQSMVPGSFVMTQVSTAATDGNVLVLNYFGDVKDKGTMNFIEAFSLADGHRIWVRGIPGSNAFGPVLDERQVYVNGTDISVESHFYALDLKTGSINWEFTDTMRDSKGNSMKKTMLPFDYLGTPVLTAKEAVFIGNSRSIFVIDKQTGKKKDQFEPGGFVFTTPLIVNDMIHLIMQVPDSKSVLDPLYLCAIRLGSGDDENWKVGISSTTSNSASLTVFDGKMILVDTESVYSFTGMNLR